MSKDRTVKTKQGTLVIWEHEAGVNKSSGEQKFASKLFNKVKNQNVFKVHSSAQEVEVYIEVLNAIEKIES